MILIMMLKWIIIQRFPLTRIVTLQYLCFRALSEGLMLHAGMTNSSFALALVMRVLSLRYSPQYLDLEIWTPTRSYFAHTIVLSTRSRD